MMSFGSKENIVYRCIYLKVGGNKFIFLILYVDVLINYEKKIIYAILFLFIFTLESVIKIFYILNVKSYIQYN